jgi:rRNA small subunit pseudouridine methyltransferase Nep1
MKKLNQNEKRGRPDIVHFTLLEALGSPLNKQGLLKVYVHTRADYVISIKAETRLPRNCNRFVSLIEQLFEQGQIPPDQTSTPLLTLRKQTLTQLVFEIHPSRILAFSRIGERKTLEEIIPKLIKEKHPTIFIGAFPHGHFSETTTKLIDQIVSVDPETLETWTVVSRVIYEYERGLSLPEKRLRQHVVDEHDKSRNI